MKWSFYIPRKLPVGSWPCLVISIILAMACAGTPVKTFQHSETLTGTRDTIPLSDMPIEGQKTHEIYFRLEKPVDRIHIGVRAMENLDDFGTSQASAKTYFIVEKAVDVSRFTPGRGTRLVFSELGRNFTPDWNREGEIDIVNQPGDPILTLDEKSLYRIRFTVFTAGLCQYDVTIQADTMILFTGKVSGR